MHWYQIAKKATKKTRHVLGISGGKDSAALAIYIKDKYPDIADKMEYFFTDTGAELQEVYDTLDKLEAYLGKKIVRLGEAEGAAAVERFQHELMMHDYSLPSARSRWCTQSMKLKPFEAFVGIDPVISYVGIRADEDREGYISHKETIKAVFPFTEDDVVRDDVFQILEDSVGIPAYYEWRSRSGCYFCFFQRQEEWLGLKALHPDKFQKAVEMEKGVKDRKYDWGKVKRLEAGNGYTWNQSGNLNHITDKAEATMKAKLISLGYQNEWNTEAPLKDNFLNALNIINNHEVMNASNASHKWQEILRNDMDDDPEDQACLICSL